MGKANGEDTSFVLDTMLWSFSRLNAFYHCKYEWLTHYYLENREDEIDSAFGQFGGFCHKILEKFIKGELDIFDISEYYEENYSDYVTVDFPKNNYVDLNQQYYEAGKEYFDNIDLGLEDYEVLGVEKEYRFKIDDTHEMQGFIDLLLRNKETGEITILDHKSSKLKFKKDGTISKTDADHYQEFKRQLYLYAIPVIEEYGHVDYLEWNMFRAGVRHKIPFVQEEFEEAKQWAQDTLKLIYDEEEWLPVDATNNYYCNTLCSSRDTCKYRFGDYEE